MKEYSYTPYLSKTTAEIAGELNSELLEGLAENEVLARQKQEGLNQLKTKETVWTAIFIRQLKSPFIYLLLLASLLALILGELRDSLVILLFVAINTILGFFQEYRSEQALKLLKSYIKRQAGVLRSGEVKSVPVETLVRGDILMLKPGDIVPADARLVEAESLLIDESILTGESQPVIKTAETLSKRVKSIFEAANIVFSGTTVTSGRAKAIVIAKASDSYIGGIAGKVAQLKRVSTFEKNIGRISKFILVMVIITLILVFGANWIISGGKTNMVQLLIFSIALATAVIPEALPLVMTFSLSKGAVRLAKKKVVVKRLSAIEDLGSIEVLCTDKTGTLTENRLALSAVYPVANSHKLKSYGFLVSRDDTGGKSADVYHLALGRSLNKPEQELAGHHKLLKQLPFDPERKRASAVVLHGNHPFMIVQGAPEAVLNQCRLLKEQKKELKEFIDTNTDKGLRVLALATRAVKAEGANLHEEELKQLDFQGLLAFEDPIKLSAKSAIAKARALGVRVIVLTGDDVKVSGTVAEKLGLIYDRKQVITGEEFENLPVRGKRRFLSQEGVVARATPNQKLEVIELLKERYEVGYMGEGINDAPALKAAAVGLAVSNATEIAKETADIILLQKSLKVVIDGIEEGRTVFDNTLKYVKMTLTSNFGNFYAVAVASLLVDYLPMLPIQILLVNLLSDFPLIAVATDTTDRESISRPESFNLKDIALFTMILGAVSTLFDFLFFGIFSRIGEGHLQTYWFMGSILTELVLLYSLRTRTVFFRSRMPSKTVLVLTVLAAAATVGLPLTYVGRRLFSFIEPSAEHLGIVMLLVLLYFVATEIAKLAYYKFNRGFSHTT